MPLNILDAEDIELGARRKADEYLKEFQFRWEQPQIDVTLNMVLGKIISKINPKAAKQIDDLFTGGKNGKPR